MKEIVLLGAGGHALNIVDLLLNEQDEFKPIAVLSPEATGDVLGVPIIGTDALLPQMLDQGVCHAFPAVGFGQSTNNTLRKKVFEKILDAGFEIPNLISNKSFIRSEVTMGRGNLVQAGSVVDTRASLGDNIAVGFNVLIGHHCTVESHATFAGGVILNGGVRVGEGTFLGMGSVLYKDSGAWSKLSPGTACLEEVPQHRIAFGNPVRFLPNMQGSL